ncbi:MAG: CvpA family protein [Sandarakinorhabdus sp.]|nr:CvpA family protein [Sandarakinorhabdus sp.]
MDQFTAFDIVAMLLVAVAALAGLARGFVGEVVSLLAWAAGILAVRYGFGFAKPYALRVAGDDAGAAILAFVLLFIGAFIAVRVLGGQVSRGAKNSIIGPVDRVLGLGFGAAKGVLAAALLFLVTNLAFDTIDPGEPSPPWITKARTAPTLAMISKVLVDFVEKHQRLDADTAAADPKHRGVDQAGDDAAGDDGYAPGQRSALDKLLDSQEKSQPSTAI